MIRGQAGEKSEWEELRVTWSNACGYFGQFLENQGAGGGHTDTTHFWECGVTLFLLIPSLKHAGLQTIRQMRDTQHMVTSNLEAKLLYLGAEQR